MNNIDKNTEILSSTLSLKELLFNTNEVDDSNIDLIRNSCSLLAIKIRQNGRDTSLVNLIPIISFGHKTDNRQLKLNALRSIEFECLRLEALYTKIFNG